MERLFSFMFERDSIMTDILWSVVWSILVYYLQENLLYDLHFIPFLMK